MFGASFKCMRDGTNRWMAPALETGNRYMYLQLAWPSIFQWLTPWLDHLAYPDFHSDSKKFLELCQNAIKHGADGEHESIYGLMLADLPDGIPQEECEVDAYSIMRGGELYRIQASRIVVYSTSSPQSFEAHSATLICHQQEQS